MNPDREAVAAFVRNGALAPLAITTNPLALALKLILVEARACPGCVVLHFEPQSLFIQGAGVLQGGALSAMVDFAMAFAAMPDLRENEAVQTTTLDVAFLRAARPGRYEARGEVVRRGKTIVFARAELRALAKPELVATAASTLLITPSR